MRPVEYSSRAMARRGDPLFTLKTFREHFLRSRSASGCGSQRGIQCRANGDNYRVRELADIVKETVPGTEIEYAAGRRTG